MSTIIFDPLSLGNTIFKNRLVMAPMCMYASDEGGQVKDFHLTHYESRAIGGVGAIILEATAVEERGVLSGNDLGIWSDQHLAPLQKLVNRVKPHGTPIGIQLAHAGRKAALDRKMVSASALSFDEHSPTPTALLKADIDQVIQSFVQGATRAVKAGFDFIELHAAHGYLINQFMSPVTNQRTDEYGGTAENRSRFLLEIIEAIRKVMPQEMMLSVRVSAHEYTEMGNCPPEVALLLNLVKMAGVNIAHISSGGLVNATPQVYPGYQLGFAQTVKELTGLPVIAGGMVSQQCMVEEVIGNKRADLVFLGRALLRDPYLPMRWAAESGHKELVVKNYTRAF